MDSRGSRRRHWTPPPPLPAPALRALAESRDKGPWVRGCPRGECAGLLPLRPHERARHCTGGLASWDQQE